MLNILSQIHFKHINLFVSALKTWTMLQRMLILCDTIPLLQFSYPRHLNHITFNIHEHRWLSVNKTFMFRIPLVKCRFYFLLTIFKLLFSFQAKSIYSVFESKLMLPRSECLAFVLSYNCFLHWMASPNWYFCSCTFSISIQQLLFICKM